MRIKMFLLSCMVILAASTYSVMSYAQSLEQTVATVTHPPKVGDYATIQEAFSNVQTYVAAVFVFIFAYLAQWIPGLATVLSYIKPYVRALTIGIAVLWTMIAWGKIHETQASFSFILSNLLYILLSVFKLLPATLSEQLSETRQELAKLPI